MQKTNQKGSHVLCAHLISFINYPLYLTKVVILTHSSRYTDCNAQKSPSIYTVVQHTCK